ncbi:DeoR/GlpR family DNA-binding transcription regulator [Micromonospora sp. SL1-18]|uniref:DeoR/GlpR family DNA-binding transcription regulator n=1 Tax=Micromonospora sp. SL1-18 TaxID=3399128 RepID=UPI003A4E0E22
MLEDGLRYNSAPARRQRIVSALRTSGFLSVSELAQALSVSDMTVRRDLRILAEQGEVRMVHGGVSLPHGTLQTPSFIARAGEQAGRKRRIALRAVELLQPDEVIVVDAGTTTYEFATSLPETFGGAVVTHSVPLVSHLLHRPGIRVIGLGGELHALSQAFVGTMTVQAARRLRVRTAFMGAAAIDSEGIYVHADIERETKLALMDIADTVVLLADHDKFQRLAPIRLCELGRVDRLVTDAFPAPKVAERLASHGVEIIVAEASSDRE